MTVKKELQKDLKNSHVYLVFSFLAVTKIIQYCVDDIVLAFSSTEMILKIMERLNANFKMKLVGKLKYILGWEITRNGKMDLYTYDKHHI